MKIALPANDSTICSHFGHCEYFKVYELSNNAISNQSIIANNIEHQPGALPRLLKEHHINVIIADGIGHKAIELFNSFNIKVIIGVKGNIKNAINKFIQGTLESGYNGCSH